MPCSALSLLIQNGPVLRMPQLSIQPDIIDKDKMLICHGQRTKKESDSLIGFKPIASQILVGLSNH